MNPPIRLLIAEDHRLVRRALRLLLENEVDLTVIAEAATGEQAVARALELRPDVILMDVLMPGEGGIAATRRLRAELPDARILIVSALEEPYFIRAALAAGAVGYISKSASAAALTDGVRSVHRGHSCICVPLREKGLPGLLCPDDEPGTYIPKASELALSERESQVLELVAFGHTAREIATRLQVGIKTVESYRARLSRKLGIESRAQLVRLAVALGIYNSEKLIHPQSDLGRTEET